MKQRVADYIADFLSDHGIADVFMITGGGAMHLNDAFGHHGRLRCIYNHHEQACAIAAEGYARINNQIAAVCVTSGPGGTNAITGVLGGWLDSIPMFILSGQVKYETTVAHCGLPLRQLGDQEFCITRAVECMTKYAVMVTEPLSIGYHLEKAFYLATHGRPGPVWLDIPLNVQGAVIETDDVLHFDVSECASEVPEAFSEAQAQAILEKISHAKAPVVMVGTGVRISGAQEDLIRLMDKLQVPIVTAWNAHDLVWNDYPYYCGRPGTVGTRGGNIVVQNADVLLVLGCRCNIRQISYNWENFAKKAYKILVDIDPVELQKPTVRPDMAVCGDAGEVIRALLAREYVPQPKHKVWLSWCRDVDARYPVVREAFFEKKTPVNPYVFLDGLFRLLSPADVVVASNGSACVCSFQAAYLQRGQRLFSNSGCASMGYGLPAAIGAAFHPNVGRVLCLEGDGSIQMNLQELQTVVHHQLDLKIVWLNNDGYHSIRQTQTNLFSPPLCGVNKESGVSFPSAERLAAAYGLSYFRVDRIDDIEPVVKNALAVSGPVILEVILDPSQNFEPKLSAKRLPDGRMVSPSLEDMFPFLPAEEMAMNQYNG